MGATAAVGGAAIGGLAAADALVSTITPKPPELPAVPDAPEFDAQARRERDLAAQRERALAAGRPSTILTGGLGDPSTPQLASAVLLGQ